MYPLIALHVLLTTLADDVRAGARSRLGQLRGEDPEAGLSTLEVTVIALGLFLIAGAAVLALTNATQNRLDQIK